MTDPVTTPTEAREAEAPALVPLNAVFADDFLEILVPVMSNNTMTEVAAAVAHHVEGVRVPERPGEKVVYFSGRAVDPSFTVAQAGIGPLAHVRVDYAPTEGIS